MPLPTELKELGRELRAAEKLRAEIVSDLNETMVDARQAGLSISEISRLTGIPRMTVSDHIKKELTND